MSVVGALCLGNPWTVKSFISFRKAFQTAVYEVPVLAACLCCDRHFKIQEPSLHLKNALTKCLDKVHHSLLEMIALIMQAGSTLIPK